MRIQQLFLETSSLHRTRLFYHKTLELNLLSESAEEISFQAGRSVLSFRQAPSGRPFYHFAFNITNNKFSDSFEWLSRKLDILPVSDELLIARYDNWNAQSFYFHDNNGSIVEFISRFDLPYYSAQPFSSDCVEEISEIGLVVEDVNAIASGLHRLHQIPYFPRGPQLPDFIALGDDHGLLLVCQDKRGWVPTHKPAQKFPVTVIGGNGQRITIG